MHYRTGYNVRRRDTCSLTNLALLLMKLFFFTVCFPYCRVAVSRSKDVPPFGPNIPAGAKFGKQKAFADFLLTKGKGCKLRTMYTML